jgi:preprotein translocase subunit SecB|tara:strand:- start:413 stop:841 length:429 start_codon:yes stop_codon:yes gene_type:complete
MKMTKNFKIINSFIKDMSSETPDTQTFILVRDKISKYQLNIDINSKALKDGIIEVNTVLKFSDQPEILKKSHFEITYTTIVTVDEKVSDKKEMEKIILCDVPNEIYSDLERIFLNLLTDSGYPGIKIEKKIDFAELYKQRSN